MINIKAIAKPKSSGSGGGGSGSNSTIKTGYGNTTIVKGGIDGHYLWGQFFDATQDINGDLTSTGAITSASMSAGTITSTQNLIASGILTAQGAATFNGATTFNSDVAFNGTNRPTFAHGFNVTSGTSYFGGGIQVQGYTWLRNDVDIAGKLGVSSNLDVIGNITSRGRVQSASVLTTDLTASRATLTNLFATNGSIGDLTATNITATDILTENLTVTGVAHFFKLVIDELKSTKGMVVISPGNATFVLTERINKPVVLPYYNNGEAVEIGFIRCYFLAEEIDSSGNVTKTIYNSFEEGDCVVCHTFNLGNAGTYSNVSNKFYWKVIWPCDSNPSVSSAPVERTINGITRKCHYIDLLDSQLYADNNEHITEPDNISSYPEAGDEVAVLGNMSNTSRQNAIIISAQDSSWLDKKTGTGQLHAPYIVQYKGINPVFSNYEGANGHLGWDLYPFRWSVISRDFNNFRGSLSLENGSSVDDAIEDALQHNLAYVHYAWANSADGQTDFTKTQVSGTVYSYMGFCSNHTQSDAGLLYTDYTWCKIKGDDGRNGTDGLNGKDGVNGADGTNQYFHVAYANKDTNGNIINFSVDNPTNRDYIGTYVDNTLADSNDPTKYTWMLVKGAQGADGEDGIPGTNGINGQTSYLHIKYSNDGGTTFTANNGETPGYYLGQYVDFTQADSSNPASYTWALIKGLDGTDGKDGTGVRILGHYNSVSDFTTAQNNGTLPVYPPVAGDAYVVGTDLYVYDGTQFINCGRIKGEDGRDGTNGINGTPAYVHIAWANSADGQTDFTVTKVAGVEYQYMGIYTDALTTDSTNPQDYVWTKVRGNDGTNGTNGKDGKDGLNGRDGVDGADGTSSYFHVAYANKDTNGNIIDFSRSNPTNREWIGTYVDQIQADSTTPSDYAWTLMRGAQGEHGINGTNGTNGQTSYLHIKYSNDGGTTFTANNGETPGYYLGQYVDFTELDSSDITKYKWALIKGQDGEDGMGIRILGTYASSSQLPMTGNTAGDAYIIGKNLWVWDGSDWTDCGQIKGDDGRDGTNGINGTSAYVHIAWANSADGRVDFTTAKVSGMTYRYMGIYADSTQADSNDYTKYIWTLIKGADAIQYYTWIKYADDNQGTGFSDTPIDNQGNIKKWIGFAYNQTEQVESNDWSLYTWSKYAGDDGANGTNGINGANGADGITYYTWIKYADELPTSNSISIYDTPGANTYYIGIAVNKTTQEESSNYRDYTWSKWRGDNGVPGPQGAQGDRGNDGSNGANAEGYHLIENYAFARIVLKKDGSNQPIYDSNGNPQWKLEWGFSYNVLYINGPTGKIVDWWSTPPIYNTGLEISYKWDNDSSWYAGPSYTANGEFATGTYDSENANQMNAKCITVRLMRSTDSTLLDTATIPVVIDANGVYVSQEHLMSIFTDFQSTYNSDSTTWNQRLSSFEQTVNGLSSTVSSHTTQISNAQTAANNAQYAADNAQSDVNNLSGTVTTVQNEVSSLQQTANSISSTVSSHTTQINGLSGNISNLSSDIENLQGQIDATKINQLGGTNLLQNTMFEDDTNGVPSKWAAWGSPSIRTIYSYDNIKWCRVYTTGQFQGLSQNAVNRWGSTLDEGLKPNTDYTFAVDAWGSGTISFGIHFLNSYGDILNQSWKSFTLSGDTQRLVWRFKTSNNVDCCSFNMMIGSGSAGGYNNIYFAHPKLEIGDVMTDWSTSPFDASTKIAELRSDVSSIQQTASQIQSTVESHTTQINTAQSTANQAQSDVNSLSGTVSTHTSQISQITQNASSISSRVSTIENTVNNLDISDAKKVTVDATGLSSYNCYPVIIDFNRYDGPERIRCQVRRTLDGSYGVPSYSTHGSGFACNLDWYTKASAWGTNEVNKNWSTSDNTRYINDYKLWWVTDNNQNLPVIGSIGQNTELSREVVYVRGGSKYDILTTYKQATITLYSNGYSWSTTGSDGHTYTDSRPVISASSLVIPRKDALTYSEIIQTSDGIALSVYDNLRNRTGIDVENGSITLNANNTTVVGNLNITDASNGITVYETQDGRHIPRVNLQPKEISTYSTLSSRDVFDYLRKNQGSFSRYKTENNVNYYKNQLTFSSTGSNTIYLYQNDYVIINNSTFMLYYGSSSSIGANVSLKIIIKNTSTNEEYTLNCGTMSRDGLNHGSAYYETAYRGMKFTVPKSGTYAFYVNFYFYNGSVGTNTLYGMFNTSFTRGANIETYMGKDGMYSRQGAFKSLYMDAAETRIQNGMGGLRIRQVNIKSNVPTIPTVEIGAGYAGSMPNIKPIWLPIWNYTPIVEIGAYDFTQKTIYYDNGSYYRYAYTIDPNTFKGILHVSGLARDTNLNTQQTWIVLPSTSYFIPDGESQNAGLPRGYSVTIINDTEGDIYVVPTRGSSNNTLYSCAIRDANGNYNQYFRMAGSENKVTRFINISAYSPYNGVWFADKDT